MADLTAAVASLVAARVAQMVDACTVTRPAKPGQTPTLDADGNVTTSPSSRVYTGPCLIGNAHIQRGMRVSLKPNLNDLDTALTMRGLKVPLDAALLPGDVVTVTATAFTPAMVGQRFEVLHEDDRTFTTYRSYMLKGSSYLAP